jgi:methionyl-tRNA formyltransferase
LKHEIDTGDILLQEKIIIEEDETAGELHNRMKQTGAALLVKTVQNLADGTLKESPQSSIFNQQLSSIKHAPKIFTETCKIDWSKSVTEVYNLIRGLAPYPAAFTELNEKKLKIYRGQKESKNHSLLPGEFETDKKTYLKFACIDGFIDLRELQIEGKKRMEIAEFLKGYRFL